jgi:uncharacterized membrane protein
MTIPQAIVGFLPPFLLIVLGLPLWRQRAMPGKWIALPAQPGSKDLDLWYNINRFFGRLLVFAGLLSLLFNLVILFFVLPMTSMGVLRVMLFVELFAAILCLFGGVWYRRIMLR